MPERKFCFNCESRYPEGEFVFYCPSPDAKKQFGVTDGEKLCFVKDDKEGKLKNTAVLCKYFKIYTPYLSEEVSDNEGLIKLTFSY